MRARAIVASSLMEALFVGPGLAEALTGVQSIGWARLRWWPLWPWQTSLWK